MATSSHTTTPSNPTTENNNNNNPKKRVRTTNEKENKSEREKKQWEFNTALFSLIQKEFHDDPPSSQIELPYYLFKKMGYEVDDTGKISKTPYNNQQTNTLGRTNLFHNQPYPNQMMETATHLPQVLLPSKPIKKKRGIKSSVSLLENKRLVQLLNNPSCPLCGSKFMCQEAEGNLQQTTTNGVFILECTNKINKCAWKTVWKTQEEGFLDKVKEKK